MAYLRHVDDAKGWRQLISVSEGDLVSGSFQGDLCPKEETVPQYIPVGTKIKYYKCQIHKFSLRALTIEGFFSGVVSCFLEYNNNRKCALPLPHAHTR